MTARAAIVEALTATGALPGVTVLPYARDIDPPDKSVVMVRIDEVRPSKAASGFQDYDFALLCIAAKTEAGAADDELDALLEDVLLAVVKVTASNPGVTWTTARRATFGESQPAYEVAVTVTIAKE